MQENPQEHRDWLQKFPLNPERSLEKRERGNLVIASLMLTIKSSLSLPALQATSAWPSYSPQLNHFTPKVSYGDVKVILTSESVDEILQCDHSNETLSAVLSHGTIYI